jgi:signal peptide peptidase SppA
MCFDRKLLIPVISLRGVIRENSGLSFKGIRKIIDKAFDFPDITTVALIVNSPGGSPVQSELIYKYIRKLADENDVEVITFVEDYAASGGYYLACAGDKIFASSSSVIGSIGVVADGFGFQDLIAKIGVERRIYTQGENKVILDPFLPQKDSDVEILNDVSKDIHLNFIDHVKERRDPCIDVSDTSLFSGKFWSGKKAKELGLIDGIGDIYSVLENKYGKNIKLEYVTDNKGILDSLKEIMSMEIITRTFIESAINVFRDTTISSRVNL